MGRGEKIMKQNPNILILGEHAEEVNKIAKLLTAQKKYQVYAAYLADDALEIIRKENKGLGKLFRERIKLVVFEGEMPGGLGILKRLKKIDPDLRTIIISSQVQMGYWLDAYLECGSIAYLALPLNEDELVWTIEMFFQGREGLVKTFTFRDISMRGMR
jgi:DNA-binding NtrC family response regulator